MGRHDMDSPAVYMAKLHGQHLDEADRFLHAANGMGPPNSNSMALIGIGHALMALNVTMERIADRLEEIDFESIGTGEQA